MIERFVSCQSMPSGDDGDQEYMQRDVTVADDVAYRGPVSSVETSGNSAHGRTKNGTSTTTPSMKSRSSGSLEAVFEESPEMVLEEFRSKERAGLPPRLRWQVWKLALNIEPCALEFESHPVGCTLTESSSSTRTEYVSLCEKAENGFVTDEDAKQIQEDIGRTGLELDDHKQQCLSRLLRAFVVTKTEQGVQTEAGRVFYIQGMAQVAALLLRASELNGEPREDEAFQMFARLLNDYNLGELYGRGQDLTEVINLQAQHREAVMQRMPCLHEKLQEHGLFDVYCPNWFLKLYVAALPFPLVLAIADVIVCGFDQHRLRIIKDVSVSLVELMSPALLLESMDGGAMQNALINFNKIPEADRFVCNLGKQLEIQPTLDGRRQWHVLATGYAGFVAGSAESSTRARAELNAQLNAQEGENMCKVQDTFNNGVAIGIVGGAVAAVVFAAVAYCTVPIALALSTAPASSVPVVAASVPVNLAGLLWLSQVSRRAAEPFWELGQDISEALESLASSVCQDSDAAVL